MKVSLIISILLLLSLISCSKRYELIAYQDPYLDAFRGRGIKYMISYDPEYPKYPDTVFFDNLGNIFKLKSFGLKEQRAYDSLHFIKRILRIDDTPQNYLINYFFNKEGYLIQEWNEIKHLEWSFNKSEIKSVSRVVKFELDKRGRVIQEIDTTFNERTFFKYESNGLLTGKEIFSINPKVFLRRWGYIYDDTSMKLKSINFGGARNLLTHYYSDGLLDSTIDIAAGISTKYKYVFY